MSKRAFLKEVKTRSERNSQGHRDKIVSIRTTSSLFDEARAMGINVSETLHLALVDIVEACRSDQDVKDRSKN